MAFRLSFLVILVLGIASRWLLTRPDESKDLASTHADFDLKTLYQNINQFSSVESLLAHLPASLRSRYVLVYKSRSLQEASFTEPRVVLFDKYAKAIVTFNGGTSYVGGADTVETMRFDDQRNVFELREIEFVNGKAKLSETNPNLCLKCHGINPRPLWDDYSLWAGVYGSENDSAFRFVKGTHEPSLSPTSDEAKGLKSYEANKEKNLRYKFLLPLSDEFVVSKYQDLGAELRPNNILTHLLFDLNYRRISQVFANSDAVRKYRFSLATAYECTHPIYGADGFPQRDKDGIDIGTDYSNCYLEFPSDIRNELQSRAKNCVAFIKSQQDLVADVKKRRHQVFNSLPDKDKTIVANGAFVGDTHEPNANELATRYALLELLNVDFTEFSMDFYPPGFSFFSGDPEGDDRAFKEVLTRVFPEIGPYMRYRDSRVPQDLSDLIVAKANFPNEHLPTSWPIERLYNPQKTFERLCIRCHMTGANFSTPLPFHDREKLRDLLVKRPSLAKDIERRVSLPIGDKDHMPPSEFIDSPGVQNIKKYIRELVSTKAPVEGF